jgi:hypothetical protein
MHLSKQQQLSSDRLLGRQPSKSTHDGLLYDNLLTRNAVNEMALASDNLWGQ